MKTQVIIPAAGDGTRLKADVPKPLVLLKGKPILIYSLEVFDHSDLIDSMIVAAPAEHLSSFQDVIARYPLKKSIQVVAGGSSRTESVLKGLKVSNPNFDYIAIHDGGRPLVSLKTVEEAVKACYQYKAVTVAVPVKPTIKRIDPMTKEVNATLDRTTLWEVQTPQVFARELLVQAHQQGVGLEATDDAFLVERYGAKVKVVEGEYRNVKITTPEDLKIAEALLEV